MFIRVGIIVNENFVAESILQSISNNQGTFLYAAPMHIKLLASYQPCISVPSLRMVVSTTTAISAAICHTFEAKFGLPVCQAYGIIEIGLPIINIGKSLENPEAVGHALPAYETAILNENLQPLPAGATGLLGIIGPGMFDAYLSPPTLRESILQNGWFLTGDYATKDANGLITIMGREKNMINVSGNKVFADEVEAIAHTYPGILYAKAYAKKHPLMGEVVALDIVIDHTLITDIDTEDLITFCRQYLASFKVPQSVKVVDELLLTGSGKVKREL